jgi:salicylate hydroxylase
MGSVQETKFSVIIVGGGIAGLTLLKGLMKHAHLDPIVYESTASYGDVGGGMALHKNAIIAMQSIDEALKESYFRGANAMLEDDEKELATEVILAEGPLAGERAAYLGRAKGRRTISRYDLIDGFRRTVPSERIKFHKKLASVNQLEDGRVEATFMDGEVVVADCLVGADGIHSKVRDFLIGKDYPELVKPVNHDGWFRLATFISGDEAKERIPAEWSSFVPILCGPQGYVNMMPLNYGKVWAIALIGQGDGTETDKDAFLDPDRWKGYDARVEQIVQVRQVPPENL